MSDASLGVTRAWIDALNRQDMERLEELSRPDIEIVGPRGTIRGTAALHDWFARSGLTLEEQRAFARGGRVVLAQHGLWRSAETGEVVGQADVTSRFEVEGGRVSSYERFDDVRTALDAAGLEEADEAEAR